MNFKVNHAWQFYLVIIFIILLLIVTLLISGSIFIETLDSRSQFLLPLHLSPCASAAIHHAPPLRVYMYDLPRKFHIGMIDHHLISSDDDSPVTAHNLPRFPQNSVLMRQHSVGYWMMASLLYEAEIGVEDSREAVRVSDPDSADVFFVPFFASLSYDTHGHSNITDPDLDIDRQLQGDIVNLLRKSKYWQRSCGRDHVIVLHHPNAFRFHIKQVESSILIVADFGRYPRTVANLNKDIVAPYVHVVGSFKNDDLDDSFESRTTLLFFQGRTVRKAQGKARAKLARVLNGYDDVHYEESYATTESINMSTQRMRSSKFCLHPAGDTPSSCRLFDAIATHCVPVIVSDEIELPFEDEIDYSDFTIFFSMEEALKLGFMVDNLRRISKERWVEMWMRLKNVSHRFEFGYPPSKNDAVNLIWRQVKRKMPGVKLAMHRNQRLRRGKLCNISFF